MSTERKEWRAIRWSRHAATTVVVNDPECLSGVRVIAECDTEGEARLIAAACELLEACKLVDSADTYPHEWEDALGAVRSALAKAGGSK